MKINEYTALFMGRLTDDFKQQIILQYRKRFSLSTNDNVFSKVGSHSLGVNKVELWQEVMK